MPCWRPGRRYPRFGWGYAGADFEVDLRGLPSEGSPLFWQVAQARIEEQLAVRLRDAVARDQVRHLSVFRTRAASRCSPASARTSTTRSLYQSVPEAAWWRRGLGLGPRRRAGHLRLRAPPPGRQRPGRGADRPQCAAVDRGPSGRVRRRSGLEPSPRASRRQAATCCGHPASLDNFARAYHDCLGEIEGARPKRRRPPASSRCPRRQQSPWAAVSCAARSLLSGSTTE